MDDELGLNLYHFRYRSHDPQIGRFLQIDPLSEDYVHNSTYAFSENKVTSHIELEGLEAVALTTNDFWRAAGISSSSDPIQFVKNVGNEMTKPSTWASAANTATQIAGPIILTEILTGGVGGPGMLKAEMNGGVTLSNRALAAEVNAEVNLASGGVNRGQSITANAAQGAAFENTTLAALGGQGHTSITPQLTIKAESGLKTRVDFISFDQNGIIKITEAKSSATAPLTSNQAKVFPSIEANGGVVVGKGKPGFPGGTKIPPTKVEVLRPDDLKK